jgi:hypothetical protein
MGWQGAAYVFRRSGTTWSAAAELTGSNAGDFAYFGDAVALSSEGETAIVGAEYGNGGA